MGADAHSVRVVPSDEMNRMRRFAYVDWASALWPLRQPGFRLTSLGRTEVGGAPAFGVRVSRDSEARLRSIRGSDDLAGGHCETLRNGKPHSVWDWELRYPEQIDEGRFRHPTQ
jgi:hypothetical protein